MSCRILNREILTGLVDTRIKNNTPSNILINRRSNPSKFWGFSNCDWSRRLRVGLRNFYMGMIRAAIDLSEVGSEGTQRAVTFFSKLMLILLDSTRDTNGLSLIELVTGHSKAFIHLTTWVTNYPVLEICNLSLLPAWTLFNNFDLFLNRIQLSVFQVYFLFVFVLK